MFEILAYAEFAARPCLHRSVYADRAEQFVSRHGWPLALGRDGMEMDEFDAPGTTYCVVHENERHLASLRLRYGGPESMAAHVFPEVWQAHRATIADSLEVSRLCTARGLDERLRRLATAELLLGLCRHGMASGAPLLFGVVYPGVARGIARHGWESTPLARFDIDGRAVLLSQWKCSALTDWTLQARAHELHEAYEAAQASVARAVA